MESNVTQTRREALAGLGATLAATAAWTRAAVAVPPVVCSDIATIDSACAPILALLPETAARAGLTSDWTARRCDDVSPDGAAALALAVGSARALLPECAETATVRALLDTSLATKAIGYGRNDPLAAIHRPYLVTPFAGPHIDTPFAMAALQPVEGAAALDAWQAKLAAYADALIGAARAVRADAAADCLPPATLSRAALIQMDAFVLVPAAEHPLVLALGERLAPPVRDGAIASASTTMAKHVQPAMALLRDTMAGLTRRGRGEPGVWTQAQGEALHAANLARAGDTVMSASAIQAFAREEVKRITALLDRRLALRGLKLGTLAERIGAAFAAHPGLIAGDDAEGRETLLAAARSRLEAAHAILPRLFAGPALAPPDLRALANRDAPPGSFYLPAGFDGGRPATLWLDTRSVYALPVPGVSPLACHLGLPGRHVQASAADPARPAIVRLAAWPAFTEGWACYAERLAAEEGLFARDPWGDIARLSDELARAARLVTDIGIHAQRWTRAQAEAEMMTMTGAAQPGTIDRIMAMPGEAASYTLGLRQMLALRDAAKRAQGKRFDIKHFHTELLSAGAKPFAAIGSA
jgi:uncharacterized protein (DUF885 family)